MASLAYGSFVRASPHRHGHSRRQCATPRAASAVEAPASVGQKAHGEDPLLLRALRGESVSRPPVWLMRQAGRYMKVYQDLCKQHTTFRERSENADLAVEISLQPWRAFQPDGVILFSDILTPISGMGIPFDITAGKGPIIPDPIRTQQQVDALRELVPEEAVPFVGEALRTLRAEVGSASAVLGFVGAPFTLATYIVEGGMSKNYTHIKKLMFSEPAVLHGLLQRLADAVVTYIGYQADNGAQTVQIFDSWAANLSPRDFDVFAGPYLHYIIKKAKEAHPDLPIILYISGSGALVERMAACGPDILSLCHSVDLEEGVRRAGTNFAYQGNIDSGVLFGSREAITSRVRETAQQAQRAGVRHILNLGHGIMQGTPEDAVAHLFHEAKNLQL
ncbi:UROD1 [Auxenochlorella protothecoides x Auxenochlorella symbiontica]